MYQNEVYGDFLVTLFYGELTLEDLKNFSNDVENLTHSHDKIFLIALPINVTKFPTNISELLKSVSMLKGTTNSVTRFYGIQMNSVMSFLTKILTQMLGLKTNTVEAKTLDELFPMIEKDAGNFPELQESIHHLAQIRADIDAFSEKTQASK
ncbi:MAG: hypothetical protein Phog2KO_40690 [Phototrophicaceae bacterium]